MAQKTGYTEQVFAWLQKGRRCDVGIAKKRWSLTVKQYQRAIWTLKKRGYHIDSDIKMVERPGYRGPIASHQLIR